MLAERGHSRNCKGSGSVCNNSRKKKVKKQEEIGGSEANKRKRSITEQERAIE